METINIIGSGLSGLSAALTLAENDKKCRLISPMPSERSQSVMAEGGINAALDTMGENDSTEEHFKDTIKGGVFLADPNAVRALCRNAPRTVKKLCALGAALKKQGTEPVLRNFGGQKKKRTAFAQSSTGKILMTALIDEVRKYEVRGFVQRFCSHRLSDLRVSEGNCLGAEIQDMKTGDIIFCPGPVILASGGMNSIFPGLTTGTVINTGDATAIALMRGAELANLEFIQYHPTTIGISGKRCLISEAARGEGGRLMTLKNNEKYYFMEEKYPEYGNLMPRDVVSREIELIKKDKECCGQVYLDLTKLSADIWKNKLSDLRKECISYTGTDPAKEPLEVAPGIHYFMGGIHTDEKHRTNIKRLYACGECACQYHGANRLGGNSMLGAVYGGEAAALTVISENNSADIQGCEVISKGTGRPVTVPWGIPVEAADIMKESLGIFRDEQSLSQALKGIALLREKEKDELQRRRLILSEAILMSALNRRESRGAHTRTDHPERNDVSFQKTTVVQYINGELKLYLKKIPEERGRKK